MAGVALNDRALGARVRRLTLKEIEKILLGDDDAYKKEIIMKLAPSILPRINEHSGENGEAIKVTIEVAESIATKNEIA
jgi:hypothetical protein